MQDFGASLVRTLVPIIVGATIAPILKRFPGLENVLNQGEVSAWLVPTCIAAYYVGVRSLEKKYPAVGFLLGLAKQPGYAAATAPPPQPAPDVIPAETCGYMGANGQRCTRPPHVGGTHAYPS